MMKIVKIIISVAMALVAWGCMEQSESGRKLTVSIEPQRFLLESVAGPKWQVTTLLSRGEDPENFDPPLSALRDLYDSRAYFPTGTIEFEHHLLPDSLSHPMVFDTSVGMELLSGTHTHGDDEGEHHHHSACHHEHETDPHVWGSLKNAKIMAHNMLDALIQLDPADSAAYRFNYNQLCVKLDSADAAIKRILDPLKGESFMVWHPSLSYFAADYGLVQLPLGLDNKEMSVKAFRRNVDRARLKGARVFLVQPDFDAGQSLSIASEAGVGSHTVNTLCYDFPGELIRVANIIANPKLLNP